MNPLTLSDGVHSLQEPYCSNLQCPCHIDLEYHRRVTVFAEQDEHASLFIVASWTNWTTWSSWENVGVLG